MRQLTLHVNLAAIIGSKDYTAQQQWAYVLWADMRSKNTTWMYVSDWLDETVHNLNVSRVSAKSYLKAGLDMKLFNLGHSKDGRSTVSIVGKTSVFRTHLRGQYPGKAVLIDADILYKASLQQLRAWLLFTFSAEKECIRSRINMAKMLDRTEQTTRNYSKSIRQPKRPVYVVADIPGQEPVVKQRPNLWKPSKFYKTRTPKDVRYLDYKPSVASSTRGGRLYYDNLHNAAKASKRRSLTSCNVVYYFHPTRKHYRYVFLKSYTTDILHNF